MSAVKPKTSQKPIAIIMGSKTDWPILKGATKLLKQFGIAFHTEVVSAHRTPDAMYNFAKTAEQKFSMIIAGAGGAAHLPGMVASLTTLPVIGVPILVGKMQGLDALLSIAQMPKGVPVATVGVNNADNAALLALRILSIDSLKIRQKLLNFTAGKRALVAKSNKKIKRTRPAK